MSTPDVSIVIPAYNEEKYLPCLLESLKSQIGNLTQEVIVVDDRSTDRTQKIAIQYGCKVILNQNQQSDVIAMRNQGLSLAKGEVILFMDADCACSSNYLIKMAGPILSNEVDITLSMRHLPLETKYKIYPEKYSKLMVFLFRFIPSIFWTKIPIRVLYWLREWMKSMLIDKKIISPLSVPDRVHTAAILVKKSMAHKIGGWNGKFGAADDTQYCLELFRLSPRVKWKCSAIVYYSYRRAFPLSWWEAICFILRVKTKNQTKNYQRTKEKGYSTPKGIR